MDAVKGLIIILMSSVLVNNYVLSRFLGICPFLGVSKKTSSAIGMGGALTFVVLCSSIISFALYHLVLQLVHVLHLHTYPSYLVFFLV